VSLNIKSGIRRLVVAVLVLSMACLAQGKRPPRSQPEPELRTAIDAADSLPFEYRADVQLGIAETHAIHNVKFETAMLERLLHDSSTATYPLKQRDITDDSGKRSRKLGTAFGQNLDALSVRLRVIRRLLEINPAATQNLFAEIRLEVPSSSCKSPMVYDVADYYSTAALLLRAESRHDELVPPLQNLTRNVSSSVQLEPLLSLISGTGLSDEQVQTLMPDIANVFRSLPVSNREFSAIESDHRLTRAVRSLALAHKGPAVNELLVAYRSFVVRGARAPRCSESKMSPESIAQSFNDLWHEAGSQSAVPLLAEQELAPEGVGEATFVESMPDFREFNGLLKRLLVLRKQGSEAAEAQGWESDVSTFLDRVHGVPDSSDCHICVFHKKADLFTTFLDFTPKSSLKQRIVNDYVQLLANDRAKDEAPLEWLFRVKLLLNQARTPSKASADRIEELKTNGRILTMLPSDAAAEIRTAIRSSNNPALMQLLVADSVLKRKYELPPYMVRTPDRATEQK
jgi:hypothetical protein